MNQKWKLETIFEMCPRSLSEDAIKKNNLPRMAFWEWCVAFMYKLILENRHLKRELKVKREVLALIRTRSQKRKDEIFKIVGEATEDIGVNL